MADKKQSLAASARPLVLVSNRGPVEHLLDEEGRRVTRRGAGGLVTALSDLAGLTDAVWVCNAITDEDRAVAREHEHGAVRIDDGERRYRLRLVDHDPAEYQRFYSIIANPMLWFIH